MRRFRGLLAGTTALTFVLVLLGIYTAGSGSGLACAQRWPFCDGAVFGLFPATWPSFVEWFHRFVAMVTGFAILGTTYAAWRHQSDRRVRYATVLATVFLPVQVFLGAQTVLTYTFASRALHFVTALTILTSLVAATAWTLPTPPRERVVRVLAASAVLVPAALAANPRVLVTLLPEVQILVSYALGLGGYVALVAATLWLAGQGRLATARRGTLAAAGLVAATLTLRRLVYADLVPLVDLVATGLAVSLVLAALVLVRQADVSMPSPGAVRSD
jgi:cytochrome c oxidase assembly protein subunit 15